jgi:hypothetical protein
MVQIAWYNYAQGNKDSRTGRTLRIGTLPGRPRIFAIIRMGTREEDRCAGENDSGIIALTHRPPLNSRGNAWGKS